MVKKVYKELLKIVNEKNIELIDNQLKSNTINGLYGQCGEIEVISLNVNLSHDVGKRNFVLAHELGHSELHKDKLNNVLYFNDKSYKNKIEREADNYADTLINKIIGGITNDKARA